MTRTIRVRLTPKAAENRIHGWIQDADGLPVLKISVTAVPDKGKANAALLALLAKSWRLPRSAIILAKGETSRNKTLIINSNSDDFMPPIPPGFSS